MKQFLLLNLFFWFTLVGFSQNIRSYDGSGNNQSNSNWGQTHGDIIRMTSNGFADSVSAPAGMLRPNARMISNLLFDQPNSIPNTSGISDFGWAFGQFMDHDISLVDDLPNDFFNIPVPAFDPFFDPMGTGTQFIRMKRSQFIAGTGTNPTNPRIHKNDITAWIDGSNVYGSDTARALWLRTFTDGKLKTSTGNLLPFNTTTGNFNDPIDPTAPFMIIEGPPQPKHFVGGDIRANEQPILASFHTLFVREHNRLCDDLKITHPSWTDEQLYQYARSMVVGFIQKIAFDEWLPALGINLPVYTGYDNTMVPNTMNEFSAAAFRLGHTLINGNLVRLDQNGDTIPQGNIDLKTAFFNPQVIQTTGIEPFFQGMATQKQQNFDTKVIGDLRNFLFGQPGAGGLDLAATNIQRGRERGLVNYNKIRVEMGMTPQQNFSDVTSDPILQTNLQALYGSVNNIDPWVGMLSEDHAPGAAIGETVKEILSHQFHQLRDGDRFYYENDPQLTPQTVTEISTTKLSDIIRRNTSINQIQDDVFRAVAFDSIGVSVQEIKRDIVALNVFPNPTNKVFNLNIQSKENLDSELKIIDIQGKTLFVRNLNIQQGSNQFSFDTSDLASGIYFLVLQSKEQIYRTKLIKQ